MKLPVQYLTHFHGDTPNDGKVKERIAWAVTEVNLHEGLPGDMAEVLFHDRGYSSGKNHDRAFSYNGQYWAVVEAVFEGRERTGFHEWGHHDTANVKAGLANFDQFSQRSLYWDTFEFRGLERIPGANVYALENLRKVRGYKPGRGVIWDDTAKIEPAAKRFYERNVMIAGGVAYCRIEPPVLVGYQGRYAREETRLVMTPYGGLGDPLIDFSAASRRIADIAKDRSDDYTWGNRRPKSFFNPIEGITPDPEARLLKAYWGDLFSKRPWIALDKGIPRGKAKGARTLAALHALWLRHRDAITDAALDEAAELMLEFKQVMLGGAFAAWLERPIAVVQDL